MGYLETIKDGLWLVHRNWQLILIQLSMVLISSIGFFIIVGIPLAIAFIMFGIDLTGLTDIEGFFKLLNRPSDILSRYIGLFLIVIASLLFYIVLIALLGLYIFGGSVGALGRSLKDRDMKFSLHVFFEEAKRLFSRLFGFTALIGLIAIVAAFFLGIVGGTIASLISYARSQDSTLYLFFGTFFLLILVLMAIIMILGIISITLYGMAILYFKGSGPLKSLKAVIPFLTKHPRAFWLYAILCGGYIIASFLLLLFSYPFTLIPLIGTILSFPYQIISYGFQTYLGLVIIATILTFYYDVEIASEHSPENPFNQLSSEEEPIIRSL